MEKLGSEGYLYFADRVRIQRRNLMIFAFIGFVIGFFDLKITQIAWIQFDIVSPFVFRVSFIFIVAYELITFLWLTWDEVRDWKLDLDKFENNHSKLWKPPSDIVTLIKNSKLPDQEIKNAARAFDILEKYDRIAKKFVWSVRLRVWILEVGVPAGIGVAALVALGGRIALSIFESSP